MRVNLVIGISSGQVTETVVHGNFMDSVVFTHPTSQLMSVKKLALFIDPTKQKTVSSLPGRWGKDWLKFGLRGI